MPNFGQKNAEELMERRLLEHNSQNRDSIYQTVSDDTAPDSRPKPVGTPRGSRNDKAYKAGFVPAEHQRVYNGFRDALGDDRSGDLVLQRVLDEIGMSRTAVLRIIPYLEKYGYIRYEAKARQHCVSVTILK